MVDSFIVVALGADLWFTTTKVRRHWWEIWWPKLLLAAAAGVSFVLNVAHAEPTWAARGVALIPPAALVLGVELLMMVLRRATTLRATRLQVEAEQAQEAAMSAPLARLQVEAMRRPRPQPAQPRVGALPIPTATAVSTERRPADTFRQAVAAAKGDAEEDEPRPRRRQAPYMVAAAILDERGDAASLTPAQLVEAMAERGLTISQSTAQALLRELRSPLSTRLANRRPSREPRPTGTTTGTGNGGRPTRPG
jgi:hypothetical protein